MNYRLSSVALKVRRGNSVQMFSLGSNQEKTVVGPKSLSMT